MIIGMIEVRIDDRLRVRKADLPIGHEAQIKAAPDRANGDKAAARKRRQWGARTCPTPSCSTRTMGPLLVMPRGYAAELRAGLELSGHEVSLGGQDQAPQLPLRELVDQGPDLRPDQEKACERCCTRAPGRPAGARPAAGKTVVVLEAWRRTGTARADPRREGRPGQAVARARAGAPRRRGGHDRRGRVGRAPLTVAMMQTLHRREISPFWWRAGASCARRGPSRAGGDLPAPPARVCSRYFWSASRPRRWRASGRQPYPHARDRADLPHHHAETLRRAGVRVTPIVRRVHTGWRWVPANARRGSSSTPR
jgi:hypothetical protein